MKRLFNLIILAAMVAMTSCGGGEKRAALVDTD